MSKNKHRKGKRRKLSSSSSGEDEKVAGGHLLTKDNAKRKESSNANDRQQQKEYPLPLNKDDSKSHRQFKKAVYNRSQKNNSEQRPVEIEVGCKSTKNVNIPSRENTPSTQTESDPSWNTTSIPAGRSVDSGLSHPQSRSPTKDTRHQTTERTAKHGPHTASSQRGSRKSVRPAEYKHTPPPLNTSRVPEKACKRKADTATTMTTEQGTTPSSSGTESPARGGRKPLKDERGGPPGAKSSVRGPRWTPKQSSTSRTRATSDQKPKRPTLAPGPGQVAPGPPCVQRAGGSLTPQRPAVKFKIPKKTRPTLYLNADGDTNKKDPNEGRGVPSRTTSGRRSLGPADLNGADGPNPKETGRVQAVHSTAVDLFLSSPRGQDGSPTVSHQPLWRCVNVPPPYKQNAHDEGASITDDNDQKMQVMEALHQAHSERRQEVNAVQSCGELTRMDTQDEGHNDTFKNDLIVVLDTNILLRHLDYVKKIRSHGLGAMGFPVVLVPWVVLQELDSLKNSKRPEGSVAHLAAPAVHFIYSCLKRQEPRLWGQSMQQASEGNRRLNAENNDDRILQCCLQYQMLHPGSALILCTNDKNLCSKALLSGVRALCKADLQEESGRIHASTLFPTPLYPQHTSGSLGEEALPKPVTGDGGREALARGKSLCVALLEDCLKEVLSHILEVEMKAAFEDLWEDIVYVKPPWEVPDVLQCMKKHWIAVFGNIVPRNLLQAVGHLCDFFTPGKPVQQDSVLSAALHEAAELLDGFGKTKDSYGGQVATAIATLDSIRRQLEAWSVSNDPLVGDAMMSDHEEKQAPPLQVSHQEVWALFENIWANVCQISSALFAALHFDPGTMRRSVPEGAPPPPPPPPEDALACLHKLLPMVTQLLHALSRVLSSDMGMEESQALLSFIHASQIVSINAHLSARDLIVCFSQQEYREKLRVGGAQLTALRVSLEHCVSAVSQGLTNTTWL
ncbi:unnamed protein product [Lota lota]